MESGWNLWMWLMGMVKNEERSRDDAAKKELIQVE